MKSFHFCHSSNITQILLYFGDELRAKEIVVLQDLIFSAVYDRRKNWLSGGFAFLFDLYRSVEPPKWSTAL